MERYRVRRLLKVALLLSGWLVQPAVWAGDEPPLAGDAQAGQALFTRTCGGCHKVGRYARGAFGPELNGIFGRKAGSTEYVYSSALKASGITWERDTLMAFIKDPSELVPGTNMHFWGISDPQKLEDLLAWLRANQEVK